MESKRIYYTMGDVTEMFDVNASLIRHWESSFDIINPTRNNKGNRLFSQQDVDNLKLIYHLVKERGMTLSGARQALRKGSISGGSSIERDARIMEHLQSVRAQLVEMKSLLSSDSTNVAGAPVAGGASVKSRSASGREPDAESKELFAFYEQRLF
ncbi:MAG: MerR family transcriptional regulator [Rikenellaceae bacterium]